MRIQTLADQLFYVTVRLEGRSGGDVTRGTGFLYAVPVRGRGMLAYVVTNRHILQGASDLLVLRMRGADDRGMPVSRRQTSARILMAPGQWTGHPDPEVDVAVLPFGPIAQALRDAGKPPFTIAVRSSLAMGGDVEAEFDSIEEVLFFGYPNDLYDAVNLTPIARRGTTATPVALDWNDEPAFLIDAAVFPGSSGSPVFVLDRGHRVTREGRVVGSTRLVLAGVVAAMEARNVHAELIEIETKLAGLTFQDPLNLGIVFKAAAIDACVDVSLQAGGLQRAPRADATDAADAPSGRKRAA